MKTAADIMTREVTSVREETGVDELARLFVETRYSAMPVLDAAEKLVGIVTETDLVEMDKPLHIPTVVSLFDWVLYLESEKKFEEQLKKITARKVGEICSREPVTCTPQTPVNEIARLMSEKKSHLLPVLDGEIVVGVVARLDVIRSLEI